MRDADREASARAWPGGFAWLGLVLLFFASFLGTVLAPLLLRAPAVRAAGAALNWLFAASSVEVVWYVTRSSGWVAYLLLWLSMVWGLAVPSKLFDGLLPRLFTFEAHEFISLLSIGFTALHVVVLMFGSYMPYSLAQVLVPFISTYRPFWVGIGILATYLILLVTVTYYLRSRIGAETFRAIHALSLLSFVGAALHGLLSGTDSSLPLAQWTYLGTVASVALLTVYWLSARGELRAPSRA